MPTHRIISLIASATEIVAALGFSDQLVGRSHECDFPSLVERLPTCSASRVDIGAPSRVIDEQVRSIVASALSVYSVDPDLLNELAPTVIITQTLCEVCAVSPKDVQRAVCKLVTSQPRIETLGAETYDTVGPSEADAATAGSVMRNVLPLPWTWWA